MRPYEGETVAGVSPIFVGAGLVASSIYQFGPTSIFPWFLSI